MLDPHFPLDQKNKQFQEDSRLLLHHLVDCLATAQAKGGVHFPDGVGVEGMTRAVDVAASVSKPLIMRMVRVVIASVPCPNPLPPHASPPAQPDS